eukprot:CAMPEP_0172863270 /NCGR_PEP_ID=MMETSP1075-20121228/76744_1 /TAXON_ID=2916 /ORGANISM="Ceratium fusus, Strain PA161109" /LENGTH=164 /DNA_ID=CAMNT_0013711813 /DNA_START=122 /DNA_END=614 /DNA_ORIENTATION=+
MDESDATQLRADVQSLQKDVASKAATIRHLQNALDAKSMTIGILSKHNREGGDIEERIDVAVEEATEKLRQSLLAEHQEALRQAVDAAKYEQQEALVFFSKRHLKLQAEKDGLERKNAQLEAALEEEKHKLAGATEMDNSAMKRHAEWLHTLENWHLPAAAAAA